MCTGSTTLIFCTHLCFLPWLDLTSLGEAEESHLLWWGFRVLTSPLEGIRGTGWVHNHEGPAHTKQKGLLRSCRDVNDSVLQQTAGTASPGHHLEGVIRYRGMTLGPQTFHWLSRGPVCLPGVYRLTSIDKEISKDIAKLLHVKMVRSSENGKIKCSKTPLDEGTSLLWLQPSPTMSD